MTDFLHSRVSRHSRLNVRKSHPGLYHSIMTVGLAQIALAANFFYSNPTFNPYDIHKNIIGAVFAALGLSQLIFLNAFRDLAKVRITLAISIWFTFLWGIANTQQFLAGNASLQLPILYLALCILQIPLVIEAPVNLTTKKKQ